ncbi:hypothetical protein V1281_002636 [Nitrobacteraceae bacterium AZCC 2161]
MQNNNNAQFPSGSANDNPCAALPMLRSALYDLMGGKTKSQVRFGDQWLSFHNGNVKELRAEVRRLEIICGTNGQPSNAGRAVRVGPRFSPSMSGYGRHF